MTTDQVIGSAGLWLFITIAAVWIAYPFNKSFSVKECFKLFLHSQFIVFVYIPIVFISGTILVAIPVILGLLALNTITIQDLINLFKS